MALPASDTFDGSGALSANWTKTFGSEDIERDAGYANTTQSNDACYEWNADTFADGQYGEVEPYDDQSSMGPTARNTGGDAYMLLNVGANITIYQYNSGGWDSIGSQSKNYSGGSIYRLEADGSGLSSFEDDSATGMPTGTDASLGSGRAGMFANHRDCYMNQWEGGDLAGGGNEYAASGALTASGAASRHFAGARNIAADF